MHVGEEHCMKGFRDRIWDVSPKAKYTELMLIKIGGSVYGQSLL